MARIYSISPTFGPATRGRETPRFPRPHARAAFSLAELLVVMGIMALMSVLLVPSVISVLAGRSFTLALNNVTNSVTLARQTAMGTGLPVAWVVGQGSADSPGGVIVMQSKWNNGRFTYSPVTQWKTLPSEEEVQITPKQFYSSAGDVGGGPNSVAGDLDTQIAKVKINGSSIRDFEFVLFQPDGSVSYKTGGGMAGPNLTLEQKRSGKNKYTVTIQENTGRLKVTDNLL